MILLNDFKRQWQDIEQDATRVFAETGRSGWYILGQQVRQFEASLARSWNLAHAVGVASGLDALELALRSLGCGPGTKVLTTPVSAFATTLAILKLGAVPVFADVDASGLIDLDLAAQAFADDSTLRFFVPVHLFGHALDLEALARLQSDFDLKLVEDCAQSIGATSRQRPAGSVGALAATSFYPTKNLGALGDAGAVLTSSSEAAAEVRMLRDYGQSAKYQHDVIGYNSRLDELHAAILEQVLLPRLAASTARRREVAACYLREISNPLVTVPPAPPHSDSVWHLFPVLVPPQRKHEFMAHMKGRGIETGQHYPIAIPDQRAMKLSSGFEVTAGGVERARAFCASEVSLPIHPHLSDDEVSTVAGAVNEWR